MVNEVVVNMEDKRYWYAIIKKGAYAVILLCDKNTLVCYTFGGSMLDICKNIRVVNSECEMYEVFMHKIGKMCKKAKDPNGHYFSDNDNYVSTSEKEKYISKEVKLKLESIIKEDLPKYIS